MTPPVESIGSPFAAVCEDIEPFEVPSTSTSTSAKYTIVESPRDVVEHEPYILRVDGKSLEKNKQPKQFGVNVRLASVAYLETDDPTSRYCAVLIELDIYFEDYLKRASLQLSVTAVDPLPISVPFFFPKKEERVWSGHRFYKTSRSLNPEVTASGGLATVSVKGYESKETHLGQEEFWIRRTGTQSPSSSPTGPVQLEWTFSGHPTVPTFYPSQHSLLVLVSTPAAGQTPAAANRPFPFDLVIDDNIKVCSYSRQWAPMPLRAQPPPKGWKFGIRTNYNSEEVHRLLASVKHGHCEELSLQHLVATSVNVQSG